MPVSARGKSGPLDLPNRDKTAMPMIERDDEKLRDLIDHTTETPDVEYKEWIDLTDNGNRSKIAKHLCALANYGGGHLIFGIADDGSPATPHPDNLEGYSQDVINGIVDRYLAPLFHCTVFAVRSQRTGQLYPIVEVPPHGARPVCAKGDGPLVERRRIGVSRGTHYIRVPGPKSVPIDTPELWRLVIHRSVLRERESLLAAIGGLFETPRRSAAPRAVGELLD